VPGKWKKPPDKLVETFDRALAGFPDAERRQMFGCPCVFLNGNMVSMKSVGVMIFVWLFHSRPGRFTSGRGGGH